MLHVKLQLGLRRHRPAACDEFGYLRSSDYQALDETTIMVVRADSTAAGRSYSFHVLAQKRFDLFTKVELCDRCSPLSDLELKNASLHSSSRQKLPPGCVRGGSPALAPRKTWRKSQSLLVSPCSLFRGYPRLLSVCRMISFPNPDRWRHHVPADEASIVSSR